MYYFAYGSNMHSARLGARVDVISCLGSVLLPGYDLHSDKISQNDGSGKFTIADSHHSHICGVLYELSNASFDRLDVVEGEGYERIHVQVDAYGNGVLEAVTYKAYDNMRDPELLPYEWYRALAVAGAIEHALPERYIHRLQLWPSIPDPDGERDKLHRAILAATGL